MKILKSIDNHNIFCVKSINFCGTNFGLSKASNGIKNCYDRIKVLSKKNDLFYSPSLTLFIDMTTLS